MQLPGKKTQHRAHMQCTRDKSLTRARKNSSYLVRLAAKGVERFSHTLKKNEFSIYVFGIDEELDVKWKKCAKADGIFN